MDHNQFISELSKIRSSSTFLSLKGYKNNYGEIADYSIIFHMSYKNALERSILALETYIPESELEAKARQELLDGYNNSIQKIDSAPEEISENYSSFKDDNGNLIKGVKLHNSSNTLHLYGLIVHKKVIVAGNYPEKNKRPLTLAKEKLKNLCPVNKFRQFKILPNNVERISVEHISLVPSEINS